MTCPICGRPGVAGLRPFCSRRCADIDLGNWLSGAYRLPVAEPPEDGPERTEPGTASGKPN